MTQHVIAVDKPPQHHLPRMLEHLLEQAVEHNATDLHIDPVEHEFLVRWRIDGSIHKHERLALPEGLRLINQVKVAAQMEVEHVQVPLEAQFHWHEGDHVRDVRVTVIPTFRTEAVHLRILRMPQQWHDVARLGFSPQASTQVHKALSQPGGLILVAGLAGAGKSTTLYSMASQEHVKDRIAVSIEDPTEFNLPHVRQLRVDAKRGLTMPQALATMLRMDPDILIVGEVRDRESAVTVAHAALAGRLVLATLHAPDAAGAIEALHYQSVPYYVLAATLRLVIAQTLVRRVCQKCAGRRPLTAQESRLFTAADLTPPDQVFQPCGCTTCHGRGYRGRVGVFEVVPIDGAMSQWLSQGRHTPELRRHFVERGHAPLAAEALRKVAEGVTALPEVMHLLDCDATVGNAAPCEAALT